MEQEGILKYIDKVMHGMVMKDKEEFDTVLEEGKDIPVTRKDIALVVTNLIRNIDTQMNGLESEVIDNFNIIIQSMLESGIITDDTVAQMQEYIEQNKKNVEENK